MVKVSVLHNLAGRPYEQQKLNEPPRASGDRVLLINRGFQRPPPTYNYEERQGLMTGDCLSIIFCLSSTNLGPLLLSVYLFGPRCFVPRGPTPLIGLCRLGTLWMQYFKIIFLVVI